ncbi:type II secretion system secretin GspD [Cypionkella psychrotolerans]|uniref:type II secretion system secretin GspD n=1 Tax=Cypionkella psychrotolerans TaxID=1678131 RepID=UPI0006B55D78|nr:type II secretion system secretin GspD [Cypionkella psychrotolerans]
MKIPFVILSILIALLLQFASPAIAQIMPKPATFVINLRDADIRTLSEQVSDITGRTLVLDPNVTGTVTVISTEPLNVDGVWELYQSVLAVQGFAALPSGKLWRIVPQAAIREGGGVIANSDDIGRLDVVTKLVQLKNFPATTAVGALRPLVASFGYIEAVVDTNTLVITDTAENVRRIEDIALALDADTGQEVFSIQVRNADVVAVGAAVDGVLKSSGTEGGVARVTVDPRSNVLLLKSNRETYEMVQRIVAELDVPGKAIPSTVPVTRVYKLRYADATSMAEVLRGLIGSGSVVSNPVAEALPPDAAIGGEGEPAVDTPPSPPPVTSLAAEDITIQPAIETNAVVVRARREVQSDLAALIAELDQRRPQVLIEAAIVEVSGDISEQLGVQLGFGSAAPPGGFAATSFSPNGPTLDNILTLLGSPAAVGVAASGLSIGLSRQDKFGLLLQALGQSTKANLLSTPSITTLDNQAAEIVVGQNVPFRTGTFTGNGNTQSTIERRDVGITMRVLPRVNQGDVIQLDITQEVSSLATAAVAGAADIVTNRRSIKTTVLADNGGTIVLGGLITNDRQSSRSEVPGLGKLPIVGGLFRSKSDSSRKQTLFVFLRPTILRSRNDVAAVADNRFQRLKAIESNPGEPKSLLAEPKPVRRLPVEIDGLY